MLLKRDIRHILCCENHVKNNKIQMKVINELYTKVNY